MLVNESLKEYGIVQELGKEVAALIAKVKRRSWRASR